jgi:hypothetical protein
MEPVFRGSDIAAICFSVSAVVVAVKRRPVAAQGMWTFGSLFCWWISMGEYHPHLAGSIEDLRVLRVVRISSAVESVPSHLVVVAEQPNDPKRGVDLRLVFRELAAPLSHSLNDSNIQLSFNFDRTLLSGEDIQSPLSMLRRSILVVTARLDFDRNGCNPMYCRYSSFLRPATATRYSQRLIVIRQNDDTGNSPQGTQI